MIVAEIEDILKERKVKDILDIEPKLVALVDGRVVGNNKVLNTTELDTEINIPAKDDIKLIKFSNARVDNMAIEDSKIVNIAKVDFKLNTLVSNFNNTVLNKNKDITVNKVISVIEIKFSSIDTGITTF
jgi:hypothetical protein